jgi:hypothetical protein
MFLVILVMNNINRYILWMEWLKMAYLLSDLWIEMKYRLIKMFIVSLKISDYNLFIEMTVQGLRHYWILTRWYLFVDLTVCVRSN